MVAFNMEFFKNNKQEQKDNFIICYAKLKKQFDHLKGLGLVPYHIGSKEINDPHSQGERLEDISSTKSLLFLRPPGEPLGGAIVGLRSVRFEGELGEKILLSDQFGDRMIIFRKEEHANTQEIGGGDRMSGKGYVQSGSIDEKPEDDITGGAVLRGADIDTVESFLETEPHFEYNVPEDKIKSIVPSYILTNISMSLMGGRLESISDTNGGDDIYRAFVYHLINKQIEPSDQEIKRLLQPTWQRIMVPLIYHDEQQRKNEIERIVSKTQELLGPLYRGEAPMENLELGLGRVLEKYPQETHEWRFSMSNSQDVYSEITSIKVVRNKVILETKTAGTGVVTGFDVVEMEIVEIGGDVHISFKSEHDTEKKHSIFLVQK